MNKSSSFKVKLFQFSLFVFLLITVHFLWHTGNSDFESEILNTVKTHSF